MDKFQIGSGEKFLAGEAQRLFPDRVQALEVAIDSHEAQQVE
jgi:hypothetical protein